MSAILHRIFCSCSSAASTITFVDPTEASAASHHARISPYKLLTGKSVDYKSHFIPGRDEISDDINGASRSKTQLNLDDEHGNSVYLPRELIERILLALVHASYPSQLTSTAGLVRVEDEAAQDLEQQLQQQLLLKTFYAVLGINRAWRSVALPILLELAWAGRLCEGEGSSKVLGNSRRRRIFHPNQLFTQVIAARQDA